MVGCPPSVIVLRYTITRELLYFNSTFLRTLLCERKVPRRSTQQMRVCVEASTHQTTTRRVRERHMTHFLLIPHTLPHRQSTHNPNYLFFFLLIPTVPPFCLLLISIRIRIFLFFIVMAVRQVWCEASWRDSIPAWLDDVAQCEGWLQECGSAESKVREKARRQCQLHHHHHRGSKRAHFNNCDQEELSVDAVPDSSDSSATYTAPHSDVPTLHVMSQIALWQQADLTMAQNKFIDDEDVAVTI